MAAAMTVTAAIARKQQQRSLLMGLAPSRHCSNLLVRSSGGSSKLALPAGGTQLHLSLKLVALLHGQLPLRPSLPVRSAH